MFKCAFIKEDIGLGIKSYSARYTMMCIQSWVFSWYRMTAVTVLPLFSFFFGHHFKMTFVIDGELIYYYYYYSNIYKVNEMWHCTIMCYATENDDSMFCVFKNLICIHSTKSAHRSRKLAFAHARVQSYTYPRLVS